MSRTLFVAAAMLGVAGLGASAQAAVLFAHDFENANITQAEIGGTGTIMPGTASNVVVDNTASKNGTQSGKFIDGGVNFANGVMNKEKGTFEAWVNTQDLSGARLFDWQGENWDRNALHVSFTFGVYVEFNLFESDTTQTQVYFSFPPTGWHHIAVSWDTSTANSDTMAIYLDGTLKHQRTGLSLDLDPTKYTQGDVALGAVGIGTQPLKNGMDRVRFHDDVIANVYAIDGGGNFTPGEDLIPEPASMGLLFGGALLAMRRRA